MSSSSSDDDFFLLESVHYKCKKRTVGVSNINSKRRKYGSYYQLFLQDINFDESKFHDYTRMAPETFNYVLSKIEHRLIKNWCNWHLQPILPEERLIVTIRYLATGESFTSLAYSFRIVSTVRQIVYDVIVAIWEEMHPIHMPIPTKDMLYSIADDYNKVWQFPHVIGSVDGKHVRIICPKKSGSMFFNYKFFYSEVLQAVADANYKFVVVDIGGYGKQSDGGTFRGSDLYRFLNERQIDIPESDYLPGTRISAPLADEAYPLQTYLLKLFGGRELTEEQHNFNGRLSRARKAVECAFGRLYSKWRLLSKCIETDIEFADKIVKAMCVLHNIIIDKEGFDRHLTPVQIVRQGSHNPGPPSNLATDVRNIFVHYFTPNRLLYPNE